MSVVEALPDEHDVASMPAGRRIQVALGTMLAGTASPYGYTVTLWSSGVILIRAHGLPHVWEVFLFAGGVVGAFAVLGLIAHGALARMESVGGPRDRVLAGILNWLAVGLAIGLVALIAQLSAWAVWPLASFTATCVYLLLASVQLAAVASRTG